MAPEQDNSTRIESAKIVLARSSTHLDTHAGVRVESTSRLDGLVAALPALRESARKLGKLESCPNAKIEFDNLAE